MKTKNFEGTPHISAPKKTFPKTVLLPGDPLRAKWIAETFFDEHKLVNEVRNMFAYVGKYKGKEVAVMGSGMGIASAGIYSYELFDFYNVENIIRIGTAGGYNKDVAVGTIIIAQKAYSESTYNEMLMVEEDEENILYASQELVDLAIEVTKKHTDQYLVGTTHSSDAFYNGHPPSKYSNMNIHSAEMEAWALYTNAKKLGKKALTICTISDNIITGDAMAPIDRQNKLETMVKIGLEIAIKY